MTAPYFPDSTKAPPDPKYTLVFDEFFDLGLEESLSPFLTPKTRRLGINLLLKVSIFSAVLLLISFTLSWYPQAQSLSTLFLIAVYFFAGIPALIESIEDLMRYEINIDILMTLAAFSSVFIGSGMEGGLLLVLFAISGSMEEAVTAKAKGAISSLHKLSPTKACVVGEGGKLIERSVKEIDVGTTILVKANQIVPLDGLVIEGVSSVNLVHLTGESLPVTKKVGDLVPAGAQNLEGALVVNVTHTNADSTLSRIIQLVTQAQEARPALQRWFDKMSSGYAITIILLAFAFTLVMPFVLGIPFLGNEGSVYRSLAFLIAASPCALIIAIPIAYLSAVSICARKGILMKGGITLDALASCTAIAFDKTGTLTTGELSCENLEGLQPTTKGEWLRALSIAYAMERNAVHPIAKAISAYALQNDVTETKLTEFKSIPGYGLEASIEGARVYIGKPDYILGKLNLEQQELLNKRIAEIEQNGELVAAQLLNENVFIYRFHDTLRPKIQETLLALKQKYHMELLMLTGDHAANAERVAKELHIDNFYADLKPEDKLNHISQLARTKKLAMVGDGVNDAPALARATVGICMGKVGSNTAIEAADVVLLHDNIEFLDWLLGKAHQTIRIVKQNLFLAAGAILIAALPALSGMIPLWLAVILHEGGTVLVGLNGLRLLLK